MSPKSYTHFITPDSWHIAWKKFCEDTSTSPEVIRAHTLNFRTNFKFSRLHFLTGTPIPDVVCASKSWSICNACKNLRGQHPQRPKCSLPQNVRLSWSIWASMTFLFVDQSSRNFFSPNVEGALVDKILFLFATCRCVPEIFAIKVESCQKALWILDVFSPSQILGGRPSKSYTYFITPPPGTSPGKKFCEDTPTSITLIKKDLLQVVLSRLWGYRWQKRIKNKYIQITHKYRLISPI